MKKEKLQFLESIANYLPILKENRVEIMWVPGSELITKNVLTDVSGMPVVNSKWYKTKAIINEKVNHLEKLKVVYKNGGLTAVDHYTKAVQLTYDLQCSKLTEDLAAGTEIKEPAENSFDIVAELNSELTFNFAYPKLLFSTGCQFAYTRLTLLWRYIFNRPRANTSRLKAVVCPMK
jgi:hypothetical protein